MLARIITILSATALLVAFIYLFTYESVNSKLKKRGITTIPDSSSILGTSSGGFAAHWLLVALTTNDKDYNKYKSSISLTSDVEYRIPSEAIVVIAPIPKNFTDLQKKVFGKEKVNGNYFDWWKTEQIKNGSVFEKNLGNAKQYKIFFDDDSKCVYIYWCYS